jgi:predicted metal-dependent phosphoesterase TrpH
MLRSNVRCDLHIHTTLSDGRFSPEVVIERAAKAGLGLIALTDHDIPHRLNTEKITVHGQALWLIAAAEVTVSHEGYEYHILAYFPETIPDEFVEFCKQQCRHRAARYQAARARIGEEGIPSADALAESGKRALTRLHLAQALVKAGRAEGIQQAFADYLSRDKGLVPVFGASCVETIRLIRSLGGLVSWAHPPAVALKAHLHTFAAAGLHGIEAYRPMGRKVDQTIARKLARSHGLFVTGGSDWHGWTNPNDLGLFSLTPGQLNGFIKALDLAA